MISPPPLNLNICPNLLPINFPPPAKTAPSATSVVTLKAVTFFPCILLFIAPPTPLATPPTPAVTNKLAPPVKPAAPPTIPPCKALPPTALQSVTEPLLYNWEAISKPPPIKAPTPAPIAAVTQLGQSPLGSL